MTSSKPLTPVHETPHGALFRADAHAWLATIPEGSVRLIIADPPYAIGKASWDAFPSREDYLAWTAAWIDRARRALRPDGTMYVCGFPEPLAEIAARVGGFFDSWRMLVWYYRNKASMNDDWGRSHESLLHLRRGPSMVFNVDDVRIPYNRHTVRYPERTQAATSMYGSARSVGDGPRWRPHPAGARPRDVIECPTLCNGSGEKTVHPTQKPEELIRRLVLASSNPGDLVVDPFGGAGTTYAVCEQTGRRWLGCEREEDYCRLIVDRLMHPTRYRGRRAEEPVAQRAQRRARLRDRA